MKQLLPCALFLLAVVGAPAKDPKPSPPEPRPLSVINYRGEELPVYGPPNHLRPKKMVPPQYPAAERQKGIQGSATLTILVGVDGKVLDVEILSSTPTKSFGVAAREAALQWRYKAQVRDDKPTKFIVQTPVVFNIGEDLEGGRQEIGGP